MSRRRGSTHRLAALLLVLPVLACAEDGLEPGAPAEQDSDGADDGEAINMCIEGCDPLEPDCENGGTCLPAQPGFSCGSLADSPRELHEPCEAGSQLCDHGLVCLPVSVPGCVGSSGCCVAICDMEDPQCTDGTQCYPFFEPSAMCYEDVGACVLL